MSRHFALIPGAGSGTRMGGGLPKQYLCVGGRPLLHHALRPFSQCKEIAHAWLVLSPQDFQFDAFDWSAFEGFLTILRCGGATRAETVRNGLRAMAAEVCSDDWVLVHDAARPLLSCGDLEKLVLAVGDDAVGGLLAVPVADTLKLADAMRRTVDTPSRAGLWQAQTPQMFRHAMLLKALERSATDAVTDEASAMEADGHAPLLVEPEDPNFKVTYRRDLELARLILENRNE